MLYSDYLKIQESEQKARKDAVKTAQVNGAQTYYGGAPVTYGSMLGAVSPYSSQGSVQPSYGVYGNYVNAQALANGGGNAIKNNGVSGMGAVGYSSAPTATVGSVTYGDGAQASGNGTGAGSENNGATYGSGSVENGGNTGSDTTAGAEKTAVTATDTATDTATTPRTDGVYGEYLAARDRAILDAQNSYRANTAKYGSQAEAMAKSGMSGSGYADYMKSRAYTQMRDEVQTANAKYSENVRTADATIRELFANDLIGVNNGTYTEADIDALAIKNGYSIEQVDELRSAAQKYTETAQNNYFYGLKEKANAGSLSMDEIVSAYEKKDISDEHRAYLASAIIPKMFKDSENGFVDIEEARSQLDDIKKAFGEESNEYKMANARYKNVYGGGNALTASRIKWVEDITDYELNDPGNNFRIKVDGVSYRLQFGGEVTGDDSVLEFANDNRYNEDTIFEKNGSLYFYRNGKVYSVRARTNSYKGDFDKLKKLITEANNGK